MEIAAFVDQYELAAGLYGIGAEEMRRRDQGNNSVRRWLAIRNGNAVGAVTARLRPDNRMFVTFVVRELSAYGPLTETAAAAAGRTLYTTVDEDDRPKVIALTAAGFAREFVAERFRIRFDTALARLSRAWVPSGLSIHTADSVDQRRLFTLDNTIRHDIPGTDGWRGDREWFRDELTESPPFDASAYLVAVDNRNGEYVGLVRIWRNPTGPRFGLVGVIRQYRDIPIAAALLKHALTAASEWGHPTFTTETSRGNKVIYPRLKRLDAEHLGQLLRLIRR
ncbi:MAG: hypothetical protein BMS9Abin07_0661 [Acidimicrobiia bacterium]|nr:MAG: hypothetical protein BMS9Abin07_0661 [Acidimicrobiia bacterium]